MRAPTLLVIPIALLALGCKPRLSRSQAEALLGKAYPVVVTMDLPDQVVAGKGSPAALRLAMFKANLASTGWFDITSSDTGSQETCTFRLRSGAPATITAAPNGFKVPAAQAVFVRALRMQPTREGAQVTYQIRLTNPTAQFPLFQTLHPTVALGAMKERHATFTRLGGHWELTGTDEVFQKAH